MIDASHSLEDALLLLLEDEPIIAMALEDMLSEAGAQVAVANSLDEAWQRIEGNRIDAAVLDVNIHGEKSYPVARALLDAGIPFIFASGYGNAHPAEFASVPTVNKPYDLAQIAAALSLARYDAAAAGRDRGGEARCETL